MPFWLFVVSIWGASFVMLGTGFLWGSMWAEGKLGVRIKDRQHVHKAQSWDGYFEHCKCGASSGDMLTPKGNRYISFEDWPR